jgi:ArsR family metal-binding transcriptional regulator
MIDELFPHSEISEEKPCSSQGKVQVHLRLDTRKSPLEKLVKVSVLADFVKKGGKYDKVSFSASLGLIKLEKDGTDINIMASGRIIVKNVKNVEEAIKFLDDIATSINDSCCFLASK